MRPRLPLAVPTVLLLVLLLLVPPAGADAFSGSITVRDVLLEGASSTQSPDLVVRLGHQADSFRQPPLISASAQTIILERDSKRQTQVCLVNDQFCNAVDLLGDSHAQTAHDQAQVLIDRWQPANSELLLAVGGNHGAGTGTVHNDFDRSTPLRAVEQTTTLNFGSDDTYNIGAPTAYQMKIGTGQLTYDPRVPAQIEYTGDFELWLFGATFRIQDAHGTTAPIETGHRIKEDSPVTRTETLNVTKLHFRMGHLLLQPQGNVANVYAPQATLRGVGGLHLVSASGVIRAGVQQAQSLQDQSLDLQGQYEIGVRSSQTMGQTVFLLTLDGQFQDVGFLSASSSVARSQAAWWWLLPIGLVVAGGGSGLYLLVRRKTADRPAPAPSKIRDMKPMLVPPQPPAEQIPAPGWDELTEEYGVLHAGERAGIFVVLVPEERVSSFVHSVASRGLIAEDTGDRVQAGEHPLAVVAVEPSPVAMN